MLAVGGLPVFNVVVVKFYINCMVAINRCMIVLVLILIYTSLTVNYSYLRIIRLLHSIIPYRFAKQSEALSRDRYQFINSCWM